MHCTLIDNGGTEGNRPIQESKIGRKPIVESSVCRILVYDYEKLLLGEYANIIHYKIQVMRL